MRDILVYEPSERFSIEQKIEEDDRIGIIRGRLQWFNTAPFLKGKDEFLEKCGLVPFTHEAEPLWRNNFLPYLISLGDGFFVKKWGRIRRGKRLYSPTKKEWVRIRRITFQNIDMESLGVFQILKLEFHEPLKFKRGEILVGEELEPSFMFDVDTEAREGKYRFLSNGFSTEAVIQEEKGGKILKLSNPFLIFRDEKFILRRDNKKFCGRILRIRRTEKEKPIPPMDDRETLLYFLQRPASAGGIIAQTGWRPVYLEELMLQEQKEGKIRIFSFSPLSAISRKGIMEIVKKMEDKLKPFHRAKPALLGMEKEKLREKLDLRKEIFNVALSTGISEGRLKLRGEAVSLADFVPEDEKKLMEMEEIIEGMVRMEIVDMDRLLRDLKNRRMVEQLITKLITEGKIYYTSGFLVHNDLIEEIKKKIKGKRLLTIQEFKKLTSLSRKYAIPILELLDSLGITHRENSHRRVLI